MASGNLKLRVYDLDRTGIQVQNPLSVTPNIFSESACSVVDHNLIYENRSVNNANSGSSGLSSLSSESQVTTTFLDKITFSQATYLTGYTGEVTVSIVNGRASFTIPPNAAVSRLMVAAELVFPEDQHQSVVSETMVWYQNPLAIVFNYPIDPKDNDPYENPPQAVTATSGFDQPPLELAAYVTWFGNPAPDNLTVEFAGSSHPRYLPPVTEQSSISSDETTTWSATPIVPSVSKTFSPDPTHPTGIATASFIGPHGPVIDHTIKVLDVQSQTKASVLVGDTESLSATVSYNGYTASTGSAIDWTSIGVESVSAEDIFFFVDFLDKYGNEKQTGIYADGWDSIYAIASIPGSEILLAGYEEFVPYLIGQDPTTGLPINNGVPATVLFPGGGTFKLQSTPTNGWTTPYDTLDFAPFGWALSKPYRVAALVTKDNSKIDVAAVASVEYGKQRYTLWGCGSVATTLECYDWTKIDPSANPPQRPPKLPPQFDLIEPLAVNFTTLSGLTIQNMVRSPMVSNTIVADITFSGQILPLVARSHNLRDANGNPLSLPTVVFDAWKVVKSFGPDGILISTEIVRDKSVQLTNYSAPVELSLTSTSDGHFHNCQVDVNSGSGTTTITYDANANIITTTHTHPISNFVIGSPISLSTDIIVDHTHTLRSVATTTLPPIIDQVDGICISARVIYDASATPVLRDITFTDCQTPSQTVIDTLDFYTIELNAPAMYSITPDVTTSYDGLTIQAVVRHSVNGSFVAIPDGARVAFNIQLFSPDASSQATGASTANVFALNPDGTPVIIQYGTLAVTATFTTPSGQIVVAKTKITINSELQWVPYADSLLPGPTNDIYNIINALATTSNLGCSPLNDAIYLAGNRLISWQSQDPVRKDHFKIIFVLTDAAENASIQSISEAINMVERINSTNEVAIIPISFGNQSTASRLITEEYATATGGSQVFFGKNDYEDINNVVNGILRQQLLTANSGSYSNVVDLGSPKLFKSVDTILTVPSGSRVGLQVCFSNDAYNWSPWTNETWMTGSQNINLFTNDMSRVQRYLKYKVDLIGTQNFISPAFYDLNINYVEPKSHYIFYNPIYVDIASDEFISEALIYHVTGGIGTFSTINYGMVQNDTVNVNDFCNLAQPMTTAGYRQILLTRVNEQLYTLDSLTFYMRNGAWPSVAGLQVYAFIPGSTVGAVVNPASYSVNPSIGAITFNNPQVGGIKFTATVTFSPMLKILCQIVNYSDNSINTVTLKKMSVQFNTTKRFIPNSNYQSIGDLIVIPSSSSSFSLQSSLSQSLVG